jgi:protein arginine kinase activator
LDEPPQAVAVLQKLLQQTPAAEPVREPGPREPEVRCGPCGWSLAAFRRTGRLGCPACWTTFEAQLVPVLRKVQPQLQHVGKAPRTHARQAELRQRAADLRGELDRAVRSEDYERAAALRDELREVERAQADAATEPPGGDPGGASA